MDIAINKNIKRQRESKFTAKRSPYKKYQKAAWIWTDIFDEIELLKETIKKGFITTISKKYGIKYQTLLNKYNNYKNNIIINVNDENRGGLKKIFKDTEEYEIFLFLKNNFMDKNKMLCNEIIKLHALDKCKLLYPNKKFTASDGWCDIFKLKWNLSTVKCSISKIATTTYTNDEINIFLNKCIDGRNKVGLNFFSI